MATIGQKLGEARREAGLSVEFVAHETRIHPNMIRSIEEDDFSTFPSVAYARSFVSKYAGVLGIDISESLRALNSGVTLQLGDNELMGEMKRTIRKDNRLRGERIPRWRRWRPKRHNSRPLLLNVLLIALIAAMGIFYFLGFHAPTPEQAEREIREGLQNANPFGEDATSDEDAIPENPLRAVPLPAEEEALASSEKSTTEGEIEKPDVSLEIEESRPDPSAGDESGVALQSAPALRLEAAQPDGPISTSDLPALRPRTNDEPNAALRPEGTDPVEESPEPEGEGDENASTDEDPRAVPVARSE